MKSLLLFVLLAFTVGCTEAHPREPYDQADAVSLRLEQDVPGGTIVCSGWVLAHHAIVTDEHCIEEGVEGWRVNGRNLRVSAVMYDHNDHVILITDLYFKDVAKLGPKPERGDEVFTLGNPDTFSGLLLIGRVAGFVDEYTFQGWGTFVDLMILDSRDWHGCSGAAVFDSQGRVVGTIDALFTRNQYWRLSAAFGLRFNPIQYAIAMNASPQENWLVGTIKRGIVVH